MDEKLASLFANKMGGINISFKDLFNENLSNFREYYNGNFLYSEKYFKFLKSLGLSHMHKYNKKIYNSRVKTLIDTLKIKKMDKILDFGCGKGFYIKSFHDLDYKNTWGYEISKYVINTIDPKLKSFIFSKRSSIKNNQFDLIIAKDVFEHMTEYELNYYLSFLPKITKKLLIVVPTITKNGQYTKEYKLDYTHKLLKDKNWWLNKIPFANENNTINFKLKGKEKSKETLTLLAEFQKINLETQL